MFFYSPTELNSSRRILDKPPLIKKLSVTLESTLGLDETDEDLQPLVTCSSTSCSSQSGTPSITTTGTGSSSASTAIVGYVNDQTSSGGANVSTVATTTNNQHSTSTTSLLALNNAQSQDLNVLDAKW